VDEAQKLRGPLSREVREAIAHAYDYDRNLSFILTGSEVGLLHDFLGVEDERSPLFGRYYNEVSLERFTRRESAEFLERGFEELGVKVGESEMEELVDLVDGIPGWLAFAGLRYAKERNLTRVMETAVRVALSELNNLIKAKEASSGISGRRYGTILKCISNGANSWREVKHCLEKAEKGNLSSSVLSNLLQKLGVKGAEVPSLGDGQPLILNTSFHLLVMLMTFLPNSTEGLMGLREGQPSSPFPLEGLDVMDESPPSQVGGSLATPTAH